MISVYLLLDFYNLSCVFSCLIGGAFTTCARGLWLCHLGAVYDVEASGKSGCGLRSVYVGAEAS